MRRSSLTGCSESQLLHKLLGEIKFPEDLELLDIIRENEGTEKERVVMVARPKANKPPKCDCRASEEKGQHMVKRGGDGRAREIITQSLSSRTPTVIYFTPQRWQCSHCRGSKSHVPDGVDPHQRITRHCKTHLCELCEHAPVKTIAELHGVQERTLYNHYFEDHLPKKSGQLLNLGKKMTIEQGEEAIFTVDECAIRKGHNYATVIYELNKGVLIAVGEGRSRRDMKKIMEENPELSQCQPCALSTDGWPAYHNWWDEEYGNKDGEGTPKPKVYDRYHFVSQVQRSTKLTAKEVKSAVPPEEWGRVRSRPKIFMTCYRDHLSAADRKVVDRLCQYNYELRFRYEWMEGLRDWYQTKFSSLEEAKEAFHKWVDKGLHSGYAKISSCAKKAKKWADMVCNFHKFPITNGFIEGKNGRIKSESRIRCGLKKLNNYKNSIIMRCNRHLIPLLGK